MHIYIEYGIILSSFCFWFYIDYVKIFEKNVINSALIHSIISGLGNSIDIICDPRIILNYSSIRNNISDIYLIFPLISFGYGFYDLYIGIKSFKLENIFHGLIFVFMSTYMYLNNSLIAMHVVLIMEISSIFLNIRPYNIKIIDLLFGLTFFIIRLVICPIFIYYYLIDPNNIEKVIVFCGGVSITLLNIYWFYLIVKKLLNPKRVKKE